MKILLIIVIVLLVLLISIALFFWWRVWRARKRLVKVGTELLVDASMAVGKMVKEKIKKAKANGKIND